MNRSFSNLSERGHVFSMCQLSKQSNNNCLIFFMCSVLIKISSNGNEFELREIIKSVTK